MKRSAIVDPRRQFAEIAATLTPRPGVTLGGKGKGFGQSALQFQGKIFAMVNSKGAFTVKLPKARVDTLVAAGAGTRFEPRPGRAMNEWLSLNPSSPCDWLALAEEALAYAKCP